VTNGHTLKSVTMVTNVRFFEFFGRNKRRVIKTENKVLFKDFSVSAWNSLSLSLSLSLSGIQVRSDQSKNFKDGSVCVLRLDSVSKQLSCLT